MVLELDATRVDPRWVAGLVLDVSRGTEVLLLSRAVHVYVATAPCNLKKSFEGLTNEVRQVLAKDPLSGQVFVFFSSGDATQRLDQNVVYRANQTKLDATEVPLPEIPPVPRS